MATRSTIASMARTGVGRVTALLSGAGRARPPAPADVFSQAPACDRYRRLGVYGVVLFPRHDASRRVGEPRGGPRQVAWLAVGAWHVRRLDSGSLPP